MGSVYSCCCFAFRFVLKEEKRECIRIMFYLKEDSIVVFAMGFSSSVIYSPEDSRKKGCLENEDPVTLKTLNFKALRPRKLRNEQSAPKTLSLANPRSKNQF